jgi:hypothetical protein
MASAAEVAGKGVGKRQMEWLRRWRRLIREARMSRGVEEMGRRSISLCYWLAAVAGVAGVAVARS